MAEEYHIPVELFLDKDRADTIRDIALNSPIEVEKAIFYMEGSKNLNRDKEIIIKLSCAGYNMERLTEILKILNTL